MKPVPILTKPVNKVLVLGATGMLGHVLFSVLSEQEAYTTYATVRNGDALSKHTSPESNTRILSDIDVSRFGSINNALTLLLPDVIINCIGIVKQNARANDPIASISVNSLFPHQLAKACRNIDARLIHISTDCVFSGTKGYYSEQDQSDAEDLYGRTKSLGEVDATHCTTLRTSMIGHELCTSHGLLEWFLKSRGAVRGYTRVMFSGLPTLELAEIIRDYVIPNHELSGIYHVASEPISKYDLLNLISARYGKTITIHPYDGIVCDRSLNPEKFRAATGYSALSWKKLVVQMHNAATSWSGSPGGN